MLWALRLKVYYKMSQQDILKRLLYVGEEPSADDPICKFACEILPKSIDNFDTSKVTDMSSMIGGCNNLKTVSLPDTITVIDKFVFNGCESLEYIRIPETVTSIGDFAFSNCYSLTTATVGCSWKTNPLYEFDANVTVNATLHSYENGVCTVCGEKETTDINEITSNVHQQSEIFDLHGRRVNNASKGLYIVNGKKVIMK